MTPITSEQLFSHKTNVRIDDINFGNHLCHSKFLPLMHTTRALFFKNYNLSESDCFGLGLIMLNLNIEYTSQCLFNDLIEIQLNIHEIGKASVSFRYFIYNHTSNKLAAKSDTRMGFLDLQKGKLKKVPIEFINLINGITNRNLE